MTDSALKTPPKVQPPTVHLERLDDGEIAVLTLDDPQRPQKIIFAEAAPFVS